MGHGSSSFDGYCSCTWRSKSLNHLGFVRFYNVKENDFFFLFQLSMKNKKGALAALRRVRTNIV